MNFDTIRAAQNASSGSIDRNAMFGNSGTQASGSKRSDSMAPTCG